MKRDMRAALKRTVDVQGEANRGRFKLPSDVRDTSQLDAKAEKAERTLAAIHGASIPSSRPRRTKVVRDTFTMPPGEHAQLGELQARALALGVAASKSQLVRAGLLLLSRTTDQALKKALEALDEVPTGRPSANS